eukprot:scaffold32184_cov23-Tisochrysis_lutea.AAC.1
MDALHVPMQSIEQVWMLLKKNHQLIIVFPFFVLLCIQGYDYNNLVFFRWKVPVSNFRRIRWCSDYPHDKVWDCWWEKGLFGPVLRCWKVTPRFLCHRGNCRHCQFERVTKVLTFQRAVPLNRDGRFRLSSDYYTCLAKNLHDSFQNDCQMFPPCRIHRFPFTLITADFVVLCASCLQCGMENWFALVRLAEACFAQGLGLCATNK